MKRGNLNLIPGLTVQLGKVIILVCKTRKIGSCGKLKEVVQLNIRLMKKLAIKAVLMLARTEPQKRLGKVLQSVQEM